MNDEQQERSPTQATINVVLAVVITAFVVWVGKGGAPDCGYETDPDSRPAECTINYNIWVEQAFPNQSYVNRFSLDGSDSALFDACISFAWATLGTPTEWAFDIEDGGYATVPDRVVDACDQYVNDHGIPVRLG